MVTLRHKLFLGFGGLLLIILIVGIQSIIRLTELGHSIDIILREVALGSVPRSIKDPATTNVVNVGGFLNMLVAAQDAKVKRLVYAASSSTYGDSETLLKVEKIICKFFRKYKLISLLSSQRSWIDFNILNHSINI